jgi:endonuclease G
MKKIVILLIVFSVFSCRDVQQKEIISNQTERNNYPTTNISKDFDFYPTSTTKAVYKRTAYAFSYSEKHEQSEWVAYLLEDLDMGNANYSRPFFNEDPMVKTHSADWRNYKKSGYDKGHLCAAGDRKSSYSTYKETFYTSNITPQDHDFNSGIWNRLEEKTRYWAKKYNGIYVITGGVLTDDLKTIGRENVAVPNYFYKILLTKDGSKMIGFLMPHKNSNKPLYEFVTSVDAIEKTTGIDFFPKLEDAIENKLEYNSDYKSWSFN